MPQVYAWPAPKRVAACATCGAAMKPGESESGRCSRCANYHRRTGKERPYGAHVDGRTARFAKERP